MLMLIDGNSLSYAAFHANELGDQQVGTQVPFTVLNALRALIGAEFSGLRPVVLWDSKSDYRTSLYPLYKANRAADTPEKVQQREDYQRQRQWLQRALTTLGVTQMRAPGFEADDLAYQFVVTQDKPIVLVTADRDWLQMLIGKNVSWYYHRIDSRRLVGVDQFEREAGVKSVQQFVELKAIAGDPSDNIPGLGGIGEKGALEILTKHGRLEDFLTWARAQSKLPEKYRRLVDNEPFEYRGKQYDKPLETFERNLDLVDLSRAPRMSRRDIETTPGRLDLVAFKDIAQDLAFRSILSDLDGWAWPFSRFYKK